MEVPLITRRVRQALARSGLWTGSSALVLPGEDGSGAERLRGEMVRLLQTIQSSVPDQRARVIQFVGPQGGEGTSTIVRELARVAIGDFRKCVFLLDLSMHNGSAATQQITARGDLPASRYEGAAVPTSRMGAPLDATGGGEAEPAQLASAAPPDGGRAMFDVASSSAEEPFKELRQRFPLVFIDSPPIVRSLQGLAVCRHVDGTVMVLRAEHTRSPVALRAKEMIQRAGGNLIGVVLNRRKQHIPEYIYRRL
jgi:Mrp family chromosome partitioning ATPase